MFAPLVQFSVPKVNQPEVNAPSPEAVKARSRRMSITAPVPLKAGSSRSTPQRASPSAASQVVAFFEARNGRLHGFRFKDWGDHKSCPPSQTLGPTDQVIGTGNGTSITFQLTKRYASGSHTWVRTITKPFAGTVLVAVDGAPLASGWSVDTTTGVVTFDTAPTAGVAITAGFEFDVPVRFDTDVFDVTLDLERLGSITSIPLLELRR